MTTPLHAAARALVDWWDNHPAGKVFPMGDAIEALRAALDAPPPRDERAEAMREAIREALDVCGQEYSIDNQKSLDRVMRVLSLALHPAPATPPRPPAEGAPRCCDVAAIIHQRRPDRPWWRCRVCKRWIASASTAPAPAPAAPPSAPPAVEEPRRDDPAICTCPDGPEGHSRCHAPSCLCRYQPPAQPKETDRE